MKKSTIFIISFVVLAGGAALVALAGKDSNTSPSNQPSTINSNAVTESSQPPGSKIGGNYIDYSESALANTQGKKVLFFHAPWCPQCRSIEKGILEKGVPEGFTIFKVDYDSSSALKKKYEVKLQTTFVSIDDNGNKIDSYIAYSEPNFDAVIRDFLK